MKLKTECGYQFTSKLESMFTDIKTSRDTMLDYKAQETASTSSSSDLDLSVQVPPHRLKPVSSYTLGVCCYPLGSHLLSRTVHRQSLLNLQKRASLLKQVVWQRLSYLCEGSDFIGLSRTGIWLSPISNPSDTIPAVHLCSLYDTAEGLTAHACTSAHSVPVNVAQAAVGM